MGTAVYASGLPTELGVKMYGELQKAQEGVRLEGDLHLVYLILLDHPFRLSGWPYWNKLFAGLPRNHKEVCSLVQTHIGNLMLATVTKSHSQHQWVVILKQAICWFAQQPQGSM